MWEKEKWPLSSFLMIVIGLLLFLVMHVFFFCFFVFLVFWFFGFLVFLLFFCCFSVVILDNLQTRKKKKMILCFSFSSLLCYSKVAESFLTHAFVLQFPLKNKAFFFFFFFFFGQGSQTSANQQNKEHFFFFFCYYG